MSKKAASSEKLIVVLIRAHGERDEVTFVKTAYRLIDELEKKGEDTDELTHILGRHVANITKGHSLQQERPCSACGDLDGCHLWRITQR